MSSAHQVREPGIQNPCCEYGFPAASRRPGMTKSSSAMRRHRRRHHPQARPQAASGRRPLPRDLPRSASDRRPRRLDRDPIFAGARRALALAPHRRGRDLALPRRCAAQARDRRRRQGGDRAARRRHPCRRGAAGNGAGARLAGARNRSATGRWSAARWRPASPSTASSWRRRAGRPGAKRATKRPRQKGNVPVPDKLAAARALLARANRLIANEGVLDAFGHVIDAAPGRPGPLSAVALARPGAGAARGHSRIRPRLAAAQAADARMYSERVIHGEIYKARPDVHAVCHHHAAVDPAVLHFRRGAQAGLSFRRHHGRGGAVLGLARRIRRHQSARGEARGRRLARARARGPLDRADAPARRDRRRPLAGGAYLPHHLRRTQRRAADPGAHARPRRRRSTRRRRGLPAATISAPAR